jgi:hypothetical protein
MSDLKPCRHDYVSDGLYAGALQRYIDRTESALQSQISLLERTCATLTKERDEARDTARYWRDDVCQGTLKFPWEDKTDE